MKQFKNSGLLLVLISFALMAVFPVWAEPAEPAAPESVTEETVTPVGMDLPLDGSSLQTWEASLEEVKKDASESDFTTLKATIKYLLFYDFSVQSNRIKLAKKLDGMTGNEIVKLSKWSKDS